MFLFKQIILKIKDMSILCSQIKDKVNELKTKFSICYKVKAVDMDEIMDLIDAVDSCSSNIYSTDEIKVGVWIDGSIIYRKLIPHTFDGQQGYYINHNININKYITTDFITETGNLSNTKNSLLQIVINNDTGNGYMYLPTSNDLNFGTDGLDKFYSAGYIILEYTKN